MKTVLNNLLVDPTKQPMFLGSSLSLQRYDIQKYDVFLELFRQMLSFFWTPEEISVEQDRKSFETLSDNEKFIFQSTLSYQTLLDSIISRYINTLADNVSLPELESVLNVWMYFENIHSYSYTYIIKGIFQNPKSIFDNIILNEHIMKRAASTKEKYDNLLNSTKDNIKDNIYLSLIATNIMEGIKFYTSFACSFAFGELKKCPGNADILKLINRDENLHVRITQQICKFMKNPDEGFTDTIKKNQDVVMDMFAEAIKDEKEWASYLFQNGSILGLNEQILSQYAEWLCNIRTRGLGLPNLFGNVKNPIKWLSNWSGMNQQVAAQEHTITSYKVSSTINDTQSMDLSDFKL